MFASRYKSKCSLQKLIAWIKKKLADWKEAGENQRRIDKALREIAQGMQEIYLNELRKVLENWAEEYNESKKIDRTTSGI